MAEAPKPQPDKFRDLARKLEADEDEKAFEEKVKRLARKPTQKDPKRPS